VQPEVRWDGEDKSVTVTLAYSPSLADYRLSPHHPLRPERFTLAVELMQAWGLIADGDEHDANSFAELPRARLLEPRPVTDDDLALFHTRELIAAVRAAGINPSAAEERFGVGDSDTPAFARMHEISAHVVGATCLALDTVVDGRMRRAFSPAGGLHHAHAERSAGFCVYNDVAVAILRATRDHPGMRVAYIDIDAHHGDGVQEAFYRRDDVLTISIHESGRYLYPGTGAACDIGQGAGLGFALNISLPPYAGPDEFTAAVHDVAEPAVCAFAPDLIVAQLGGDSHHADPLTHLANTVGGHIALTSALAHLADEVCGGRIVACGGGGYEPYSAVPRMWAGAMAVLLERPVPVDLPAAWLAASCAAAGWSQPPAARTLDDPDPRDGETRRQARELTRTAIRETRAASPLLGGGT